MTISVGDIVTLSIIEVAGYACWGVCDGQIGFVHCVEWSKERPIPEESVPIVGEQLRVKVFRLVDVPQNELPADVTFGGKFHVDFAASVAQLMP